MTLPKTTWSTLSGSMPARSMAALAAMVPSWVGGTSLSDLPYEPTAVRAPELMTMLVMRTPECTVRRMSTTIEYAVVNPATGETLKRFDPISDDDLRDAVARAHRAHEEWNRSTSVADRAAIIRRVGELHSERKQELGEIIVREMGKPIEQAVGEVEFCQAIYDFYADNAEKLMADEPIELLDGEGEAFIRRSSYGPLLGIMPWNYPYYQVARFAGPNLIIGNTVLLK